MLVRVGGCGATPGARGVPGSHDRWATARTPLPEQNPRVGALPSLLPRLLKTPQIQKLAFTVV